MKKFTKLFGGVLVVVLVGMQLIPNQHNEYEPTTSDDFAVIYEVPAEVESLLRRACYDCHSNQTNYPWYSKVQPINLLVANHVNEGTAELNFSKFGQLSNRKKKMKIKSMIKEIEKGEMPLKSYLFLHNDAAFSDSQKQPIVDYLTLLLN